MPDLTAHDPDLVATHTTAAAASVARWVELHYGLAVAHCHLIRRGLNDNYALRSADGTRHVARLYSIRPRGDFNIDFETALLTYLHARGTGVAAPLACSSGHAHIPCAFRKGRAPWPCSGMSRVPCRIRWKSSN